MALANILVHLDSSERANMRVALAAQIAERSGAKLTGLFAELAEAHYVGTVASWPSPAYTAAVDAARQAFEAHATALGDKTAFLDANRGSDHEVIRRVVEIGRTFDLVILGQTDEESPAKIPEKLPEQVIVESGRPVLVVPYVGVYPDIGKRPLFAWHSSRGAARALADATQIIAPGAEALVVEVARKADQRDEFSDLVVADLAEHKIVARYQHFVVDEISVMDTLLSAAADHAADLIAIGAFDAGQATLFGHGVGTRHMLRHMTAPVLFSH